MPHIYQNNFGTLYSDRMSLLILNQKRTIQTQDIIKIRFIKRKTHFLSYTFLFTFSFIYNIIKPSELSLMAVLTTLILLMISLALMFKQYKIIIIKKNNFIKIDVEKKLAKDAENLINYLKQLKQL